jgi:hypothetical protein
VFLGSDTELGFEHIFGEKCIIENKIQKLCELQVYLFFSLSKSAKLREQENKKTIKQESEKEESKNARK